MSAFILSCLPLTLALGVGIFLGSLLGDDEGVPVGLLIAGASGLVLLGSHL